MQAHTISIHAPGWGATRRNWRRARMFFDFNPRTRVGCDVQDGTPVSAAIIFQSTHPGGVRLQFAGGAVYSASFQSTHPGGVRPN